MEPIHQQPQEDYSLIDKLGLQNTIEVVAQKKGKIIYAHTVYYELNDIDSEKPSTATGTHRGDSIFSEKQQRLSIDTLQNDKANWTNRNFIAASNVGIYYNPNVKSAIVPDMFLSFEMPNPEQWFDKRLKAYFTWIAGKPPELVLEIVSNKTEGEDSTKLENYAKIGVKYYIIHDPHGYLSKHKLRLFILGKNGQYEEYIPTNASDLYYMPEVNLGIVLWQGVYEDLEAEWLRWCNSSGRMLLTAKEQIAQAEAEKEQAKKQAEQEHERAEQERLRAEKFLAKLVSLGQQPEE